MRIRAVRGDYRRGDEGPLDLFADVWQEIWEDDLEKEHKKNFYSDQGHLAQEKGGLEVKSEFSGLENLRIGTRVKNGYNEDNEMTYTHYKK